jgi:DNA mismatch repair protein MutL
MQSIYHLPFPEPRNFLAVQPSLSEAIPPSPVGEGGWGMRWQLPIPRKSAIFAKNCSVVPDIIQLLPDHIANQIAAGEVIQRPASAVKELLENAVDAGATDIHLLVADAGKALVQVIDNGKGMSETDARMAFERHATSKINTIEDLFHIKTMGFRGEALASIAAVAQVTLKTRRAEDTVGVAIDIENSMVKRQEPVAGNVGTSIAIKNLFFNIPARRNFLKSNTTELRNIIDEFTRVALSFPHIRFRLTSNAQEMFQLEPGSLKQRIIQLLGNQYNAKMVSVKEETDYLNVYGFVGKPETAKKTRGDQYFFVNNRFIKSAYLNHAVSTAFDGLLPKDSYPAYVLFIDLDPAQIDINVHPTKQEIKFEDERIVYAFVNSAVKHALAQFSITPALDFDLDASIQQLPAITQPFTGEKQSAASSSSLYQTFTQKNQAHFIERDNSSNLKNWQDFYTSPDAPKQPAQPQQQTFTETAAVPGWHEDSVPVQVQNMYIITEVKGGFLLVHQQYAHQRVIFEKLAQLSEGQKMPVQKTMFPETLELSPADAVLLNGLLDDINNLGYQVEPFGNNTFIIHGTPADIGTGSGQQDIEWLLEHFKNHSNQHKVSRREQLAMSMAWQQGIKPGKSLTITEMQSLLHDLFHCHTPNASPFGKPTYAQFTEEALQRMFGGM